MYLCDVGYMFRDGGLTKNVACRNEQWNNDETSCQRTCMSNRLLMVHVIGISEYVDYVHV